MHGNNPTRDSIENALTHHASQGRIRSWRQHPDFGRYGNAPKWQVELAGNAVGPQGGSTVEIRTYQEGHLFCSALASAEQVTLRLRDWLDHQAAHDGVGLSSQRWTELDRIAGR
jgi:hypothetical protein